MSQNKRGLCVSVSLGEIRKGGKGNCVCEGTESDCVCEGIESDYVGLGRDVHGSQYAPVWGGCFLWGWF